MNDFNRDLSAYMGTLTFDEQDFKDTEDRLDLVNRLKIKYGGTIERVLKYQEEKQTELERLRDYDGWLEKLRDRLAACEKKLSALCREISEIRRKYGKVLEKQMEEALKDLNFLQVQFKIRVEPLG